MTIAVQADTSFHKGFVTVDGCRLHYIRRGKGPAAVLLHASPCSAKVMAPLQAQWGEHFTSFAFDLPGFGLSHAPQAGEITIAGLADLIAAAIRSLGIASAALYGRHTGASVALEVALRHPDLASVLLTDGLPVFAAPYSEERLAQYLPPITPRWDGGHLTWAFFRYREQHMFWPWDAGDLAHRADADLPDVEFLHRGTLELLEASATYARTYRAAFLHQALPRIGELTVPAYWGNRPGDSQFKTVPRYPPGSPVRIMPRDHDLAAAAELALLLQHKPAQPAPPHRCRLNAASVPAELHDYVPTRHGDVRVWGQGLDRPGLPQLFLHDLPGSIDLHEMQITDLGKERPVLAFDLGGNAESISTGVDHQIWLDQIEDVLAALGWASLDVYAHGTAAALALDLAGHHRGRVRSVALRSPPILSEAERDSFADRYAPDINPTEDGGYLLRLWHHLRDQQLWYPWFERGHAARRTGEPVIDPAWLTKQAVAMLKQPEFYGTIWREVLSRDLAVAISECPVPVRIEVQPSDVFAPAAQSYLAR